MSHEEKKMTALEVAQKAMADAQRATEARPASVNTMSDILAPASTYALISIAESLEKIAETAKKHEEGFRKYQEWVKKMDDAEWRGPK